MSMTARGDGDRIDGLEQLVARAIAVTQGVPSAATVDETALLAELSVATEETLERADGMVPVIEQLLRELAVTLGAMPDDVFHAATQYEVSRLKWQPRRPAMPRLATAFVACDQLHRALDRWRYRRAKTQYDALLSPGRACDCTARLQASFFAHRPGGQLILLDTSGVAYAAMDYLWQCQACGTKWFQHEGYDDIGAHSTWEPAPTEASNA